MARTVGINTDYIETTDFKMEDADKEFCYEVRLLIDILNSVLRCVSFCKVVYKVKRQLLKCMFIAFKILF